MGFVGDLISSVITGIITLISYIWTHIIMGVIILAILSWPLYKFQQRRAKGELPFFYVVLNWILSLIGAIIFVVIIGFLIYNLSEIVSTELYLVIFGVILFLIITFILIVIMARKGNKKAGKLTESGPIKKILDLDKRFEKKDIENTIYRMDKKKDS